MLIAALVLLIAVIADFTLGDPAYALHPVRLMGKAIGVTDTFLRRHGLTGYGGGLLLLVSMLGLFSSATLLLFFAVKTMGSSAEMTLAIFLFYSTIALKDMFNHAGPVAKALRQQDLTLARNEVQKIVGRDASLLDEAGVARAAVESVAEGFVDGFLSPLFWFAMGALAAGAMHMDPATSGVAAAVGFRITNTLDSMVGYRNQRYARFGTASARLDDVLNFLPARLSIPILTCAALVAGMDAQACRRIGMQDRLKHASPNAGHAESCVAGALGIRLGGPTTYPHGTVDKPWMGDHDNAVDGTTIERSCQLIRTAGWISLALFFTALLLCFATGR